MRHYATLALVSAVLVSGCAGQKNRDNEHQWNQEIQSESKPGDFKTTEMKDRLRISIEERSLYASGHATLTPQGQKVLDEIVPTLQKASDHRIEVDGYTDDVPYGELTSFPRAVQLKDDEVTVFSWITYESRAKRDEIMAKVMADERLKPYMDKMPFDGKRMIFGGFESLVEY